MNSARRAWRLPVAALSGALLGTGITAGALAQGPAAASSPPAPAGAAANTINSHAPVVRQVVPSMVLIRTQGGLGSGVILDGKGRHPRPNGVPVGEVSDHAAGTAACTRASWPRPAGNPSRRRKPTARVTADQRRPEPHCGNDGSPRFGARV
jgi:hypothetical protein